MNVFNRVAALAASDTNEYLKRAIENGKKVIGYFCSYVPEEVIHAAGFVPYRMRATKSGGMTEGDKYFAAINCSFVRHCFNKVVKGDFDFLDGIVCSNGCDHNRRIYDNWRHADLKPDFRHMFVAPRVIRQTSLERFKEEIRLFISELESYFNIKITEEALRESIKLYNRKRALLFYLYESRKQAILPIRGSELLNVMLAITMMPIDDVLPLLEEIKSETEGREASSPDDIRVYLASGHIEESDHLELIEKCGGAIVADSICYGARHFDQPVDESANPIDALAERYLNHVSCPRMMNDFRRRMDIMHRALTDFSADAVIAERLKFCDLWGGDIFIMRQELNKRGMPILVIERELYVPAEGQVRTRLQALFEQVRTLRPVLMR